jgi:hypothetical protein
MHVVLLDFKHKRANGVSNQPREEVRVERRLKQKNLFPQSPNKKYNRRNKENNTN